ncbi:MAG: hypothetical protein M3328_18830, partial [Chloroflexota bacterium]|nr:hypothetical protein [Chloroflexota bacterium]
MIQTRLVFVMCMALGFVWLTGHNVTGVAAATGELVTNGGFESGSTAWQQSSTGGYQLVDPSRPHTGSSGAYLCGYNTCNDQLWQTISLPASMSQAQLTYWLSISTQEAAGAPCSDTLTPRLTTSTGSVIATLAASCNTTTGWVQKSVDLSAALAPYAGQQVQLRFQSVANATLATDFYLDDISLTAASGSTSTIPTSTPLPVATPTKTPVPVATSTPSTSATCPGSMSGCMQAMLTILNQDRAANGVAPLTLNLTMSNGTSTCIGAYGHSVHMQQMGQISHDQFPADV